jgi:hypothetical protein
MTKLGVLTLSFPDFAFPGLILFYLFIIYFCDAPINDAHHKRKRN